MDPINTACKPQVADGLISGASSQEQQSANAGTADKPRASHLSCEKNSTPLVNRVIQWLSEGASKIKNSWTQFQLRKTCEAFMEKVPSRNGGWGELKIWEAKRILDTAIAGCKGGSEPGGKELLLKILSQCLRSCGDEKLFRIIGILSDKNSSNIHFSKLSESRDDLTNCAIKVAADRFGSSISKELTSFKNLYPLDGFSGGGGWYVNGERKVNLDKEFASYFKFASLINGPGVQVDVRLSLGEAVIKVIGGELENSGLNERTLRDLRSTLQSEYFSISHPKNDRKIAEEIYERNNAADSTYIYALLLKKFDEQYGRTEMISAPDDSDSDSDAIYYSSSDIPYGQIYK